MLDYGSFILAKWLAEKISGPKDPLIDLIQKVDLSKITKEDKNYLDQIGMEWQNGKMSPEVVVRLLIERLQKYVKK